MRKFEEAVVEETTETTEAPVEETPAAADQLVTILVDMGLSAEQAEAVHSMAQDLVNSGSGEEQKVEASRLRRRGEFRREGKKTLLRSERNSSEQDEVRELKRRLFRAKRTIRELREEQNGSRPGAERVQFSREQRASAPPANPGAVGAPGSVKSRVFEMLKDQL